MMAHKDILGFEKIKRLAIVLAGVTLLLGTNLAYPVKVKAGQLTDRTLELSTSAGNTAATWTFTFDVADTTALNGITFQPCTTASGACTTPTSWSNSGATLSSLTYNGSSQGSWALDNSAGYLRIKDNSSVTAITNPVVATFATVTNPDTTNESFFVRIVTYTGDDFTSALDSGVVAASTAQDISLSATVDESITFCTGTSGITNSSCSGATGSSIDLGTVTASTTGSGTSQFGVGTNSSSGYSVTVNGATLTSGSDTITANATQATSSQGSEQFGLNLRDNATPNIGADVDGAGDGTVEANYNTADQYRFVTGDAVASDGEADDFRLFTVSYIANISTATEAGAYTATMTYIATATF